MESSQQSLKTIANSNTEVWNKSCNLFLKTGFLKYSFLGSKTPLKRSEN
jgi:hypothetical protein